MRRVRDHEMYSLERRCGMADYSLVGHGANVYSKCCGTWSKCTFRRGCASGARVLVEYILRQQYSGDKITIFHLPFGHTLVHFGGRNEYRGARSECTFWRRERARWYHCTDSASVHSTASYSMFSHIYLHERACTVGISAVAGTDARQEHHHSISSSQSAAG